MSETEVLTSPATSLRTRVQTLIDNSGADVSEAVVQHFVKLETDRRAKMLIDGLTKLTEAEKAHEGVKPDHYIFDGDGKPLQVGFSADQKKKKEKTFGKLKRLEASLNDAITDNNFKPLEEALKQND